MGWAEEMEQPIKLGSIVGKIEPHYFLLISPKTSPFMSKKSILSKICYRVIANIHCGEGPKMEQPIKSGSMVEKIEPHDFLLISSKISSFMSKNQFCQTYVIGL